MKNSIVIAIVILAFFGACKKEVNVSQNNIIAKKIEGKWKAIAFLKNDELLDLDYKISFNITFSNVVNNIGDYKMVSVTPNYTGQEVDCLEKVLVSEFSINNEGTILSILYSIDYDLSFKDEYLVLYVYNTNKLSIVYEKI